jgi:hypothetical protein
MLALIESSHAASVSRRDDSGGANATIAAAGVIACVCVFWCIGSDGLRDTCVYSQSYLTTTVRAPRRPLRRPCRAELVCLLSWTMGTCVWWWWWWVRVRVLF